MLLEHVNFTVSDLDRSIRFYSDLLGLRVRWRGPLSDGRRAAHLGDEHSYLALFEAAAEGRVETDMRSVGLNHFGLVVDNLDELKTRLASLGTPHHAEHDYEPGRRVYFFDPDGIEVELVQYEHAPA